MRETTPGKLQVEERPAKDSIIVSPHQSGHLAVEESAPTPQTGSRRWVLSIAFVLLAGAFLLNSMRTMQAIDLTSDETTYAIESVSFGRTGLTMWNGAPFFVHPPLFYVTEAAFYNMFGVGDGSLFDRLMGPQYRAGEPLLQADVPLTGDSMLTAVEFGRYLNSFYGAVLSVLVFLLGRSLLNLQAGVLSSLLFTLDPYVLWRNHFNYLEPLVTIFGVLCIYMYYLAQKQATRRARLRYLVLTGLFFGLAMLSKELAILYMVAIWVHALLFKRVRLLETLIPLGVGAAIYSIFPIWAAASGEFTIWLDTKLWIVRRALGLIADSGLGRPGTSILDTLLINLVDYWPWLLVLGIGLVFAAWFLYLYYRHGFRDLQAELISACIMGMYGFFIFIRLLGGITNEQYFYLIMPVVALNLAYAVLMAPVFISRFAAVNRITRSGANSADEETLPLEQSPTSKWLLHSGAWSKVFVGALAALIVYNMLAWIVRYTWGTDNSYMQVEAKTAETLPPGTPVVGRDLLGLYLMPKQAVYTFGYLNLGGEDIEVAQLTNNRIPYAILNEQSLLQRYGGANPEYYEWVEQNGKPLEEFQGRKYKTWIYQIEYTGPTEESGITGKP